jgi:hypothetical protein
MAHVRKRYKIETELPQELREQFNRLLLEGMTYEEGERWCKQHGHEIGKSSIGRYGKEYFEAYQKIVQFQDQSRALSNTTEEGMPMEEAVGKMLLQKVMAALVDGSADITENSRLLSDVAKLQSAHVSMNRWKGELEKKARKAVANIERKSKNIDPETLRIIKEEVYGLVN